MMGTMIPGGLTSSPRWVLGLTPDAEPTAAASRDFHAGGGNFVLERA